MASNEGGSGEIGFLGMLAILFIGLKLAGCIDWPWWLVLSPIWVWLALLVLIATVAVVVDRKVR